MAGRRIPSWEDKRLKGFLRREWRNLGPTDGKTRTAAIARVFVRALQSPTLANFRPDAVWTSLQNAYYSELGEPVLKALGAGLLTYDDVLEKLNSTRNGWVRSSGVALENAYEELYSPALASVSPRLFMIRRDNVKRHPVAQHAVNLGLHGIGTARQDDLYLACQITSGPCHIFGVVQVKASAGDRFDQGLHRSREMMQLGFFSAVLTLDPMEVARSQRGMLVLENYIRTIDGHAGLPNGWHYVYVTRRRETHRAPLGTAYSRIKDIDLRHQPDGFVRDAGRAAADWLRQGHSVPITWR